VVRSVCGGRNLKRSKETPPVFFVEEWSRKPLGKSRVGEGSTTAMFRLSIKEWYKGGRKKEQSP